MLEYQTPIGNFGTMDEAVNVCRDGGFDPDQHITVTVVDAAVARLQECFDNVAPADDWRGAINAIVPALDVLDTVKAIIHYTATAPIIVEHGPGTFRVVAAGYRAGPAGP